MKQCTKCKTVKNRSDFYKCTSQSDGLNYWCKQCMKSHFDSKKASKSDYDKSRYELKKEEIRSKNIKWKKENKDKILKYNKEYIAIRNKHVRQATPKWLSDEQKKQIVDFYQNRPNGYHVDHIMPIRGKNSCGLHVPWNLQYLPAIENLKKGNRYVK